MKFLKIAGIVIAAVVLLLAGGVAYIASQFDAERIKAEATRAVKESTQRTLSIDGEVRLGFWPDVALGVGKVSLSERGSEQAFASLESARVSVAVMPLLSRQVAVKAVEVHGMKAALIRRKNGTLNVADLMPADGKHDGKPDGKPDGGAGRPSDGEPLRLDVAGVTITDAALSWRDERSGDATTLNGLQLGTGRVQADTGAKTYSVERLAFAVKGRSESKAGADAFELRLDAPKLVVTPEKSDAGSVTLSATLAGPKRTVAAQLALAGVEGNARILKIARLQFDLDAKADEASVKGRLESVLEADLGKQAVGLEKITGEFEVAHPRMPMKQAKLPVTGALRADLAKKSVEGRIATRFDESKVTLVYGVPRFAPLALSFDLDVDRFNLDTYLPAKTAGQAGQGDGKGDPSGGTLDFSALKGLDLNGTVKVGQLQAANIKAADLRLRIRAAGGRLDLAPVSAGLYEGTASGALSLDANRNSVAVRQNLVNVSIGPLLRDAAKKDVVEGRGNVVIDVTAQGDTVESMKRSLAGSANVVLRDGAVKGINLAQSFRDLKAKFSRRQDAVQQAKASDKTDFSELSASFKIAGGVAHNEDLSAKSPFLRLSGNGDIDIGASRLDYLAKARVVASAGGQGAKDLDHLKGLTVPVRLTGPFDNPSWKIELAGLATEAVRARVEEKKQEIRNKAQDQIKGRLRGLLGK